MTVPPGRSWEALPVIEALTQSAPGFGGGLVDFVGVGLGDFVGVGLGDLVGVGLGDLDGELLNDGFGLRDGLVL